MTTLGLPPIGGVMDRTSLFPSLTTSSTPARCVQLSHNPSMHVYHALKTTIEHSSTVWMREFLERDGLGSLVEAIEQLSCSHFTGFSDAILLLDCVGCVRSILNTSLGMTYFLNSDIYMRKLANGVSTGSCLSKKHVFELITAICVHSALGYRKTIDALQHYQQCTDQTSMFSVIISELKFSDTALYRTTLVSLINTIVNCTENIRLRCAIRNELIGIKSAKELGVYIDQHPVSLLEKKVEMDAARHEAKEANKVFKSGLRKHTKEVKQHFKALQLLDMMHHFRREEKDADLAIQLEAFSVAKHRDDLELAQNYKLNPNNHKEVFYSLYQEVLGTPASADFLNLLQDLYLMTSSNIHSSHLWKVVGKAVHHLASLPSTVEAENFITNLDALTKPPHATQATEHPLEDPILKDGELTAHAGAYRLDRKDSGISVGSSRSSASHSYYDNTRSFHRQGSGRTSGYGSLRGSGRMRCIAEDDTRLGDGTSVPLTNLKWIKVQKSKVKKEVSLWGQGTEYRLRPDVAGLLREFPEPTRLQDAEDEVELLTAGQSVALNVFLTRMGMSSEELVGYLEDGDDVHIGLPGLRYLMSVLPSHEEMMQLRGYRGERYDLGQAEQFLLQLTDLPDYRTLLTCLLFKSGFGPRYQKLKAAFTAMIKASRDILHHQGFKDFLFLVLDSGNILNKGSVFGGASGVRLATLARLVEVRGKMGSTTLLDHLVRVADAQSDDVMLFAVDMPQLSAAATHDLEEMKLEVTQLSTEMRKVLSQLAATHPAVKATFEFFIEDVKQDLQQLQDAITQTRCLSQQMALYFCEDEANFRLHTTLRHINQLCEAVKRTTKEGIYRRQQTARAEKRQAEIKQNNAEKNMAGICEQADMCSAILLPQPEKIVDCLLKEVHSGHIMGCLGDDLQVPDLEWDPLHFSQISHASPLEETVGEPLLLLGAMLQEPDVRPCLPDRVDDAIGEQYRKDNQVASSSFFNGGNEAQKNAQGPLAVPEDTSLRGDPAPPVWHSKTSSDPKPQERCLRKEMAQPKANPKVYINPVAHRRTASDPNESHHVTKRWLKYEKQQKKIQQLKPTIESQLPMASLGLEKNGQAMSKEDILNLSETVDKENAVPASKEKKKKHSSFGLLKKITRALKSRNSDNIPKAKNFTKKSRNVENLLEVQEATKKAVRPTILRLNTGAENLPYAPCQLRTQKAVTSSEEHNLTTVEKVHDEPLYKIVIYQKYQSEC